MPLLNYTTSIAATKTVAEIQTLLAKAGAEQVIIRYDKSADPTALVFELLGEMYMLPCRVEAVQQKLMKDRSVPPKFKTREQAMRVAWRILKDWTEAQVAIISTGMVEAAWVTLRPPRILPAKQSARRLRRSGWARAHGRALAAGYTQ